MGAEGRGSMKAARPVCLRQINVYSSKQLYKEATIITLVLQMRKTRHREVK